LAQQVSLAHSKLRLKCPFRGLIIKAATGAYTGKRRPGSAEFEGSSWRKEDFKVEKGLQANGAQQAPNEPTWTPGLNLHLALTVDAVAWYPSRIESSASFLRGSV